MFKYNHTHTQTEKRLLNLIDNSDSLYYVSKIFSLQKKYVSLYILLYCIFFYTHFIFFSGGISFNDLTNYRAYVCMKYLKTTVHYTFFFFYI